MFQKKHRLQILILCMLAALTLAGCMPLESSRSASDLPEIPAKLQRNADDVPTLKVYNAAEERIDEMDVESYVMGVVAGEMKNSWPMEALKAQAILARTYTMKFVSSKNSGYTGADISTDIHEAQAYDADAVNDRVREAVNETRGLVMASDGDFPHAWFHAHSGGKTELPTKALEYSEDPPYLSVVESKESADAPEDVQRWTASFTADEILSACKACGLALERIESFEIGETGESGRAVDFLANGQRISAPSFRLQIGSEKLKSTLIDDIELSADGVRFRGKGFGHGVGMSQWGAYQMAQDGKNAEEIIRSYYKGVDLVELW